MSVQIVVPDLPESVSDATIGQWHKVIGDKVKAGELLVDLETDKVVLEVPAPQDGILKAIHLPTGSVVKAKEELATLDAVSPELVVSAATVEPAAAESTESVDSSDILTPSIRRLLAEENVNSADVKGTGKDGRITREDVLSFVEQRKSALVTPVVVNDAAAPQQFRSDDIIQSDAKPDTYGLREEKRVPMTRLRKRIAERLLDAKNSTAMLTTFNEVNMKPIMEIRKKYQDKFEKRHGIKLGFMSFYVKAVCEALKRYPDVNASIDGDSILYHNYFDVSIAVSTERGLVTPVLRDCDAMTLAEIETGIKDLADKARVGKLSVEDLTGGTFTITNGGVFGSLMSTPIINPPQSAILGMHKIQDRPVAVDGQVVILPMMYLALSYDHRIIDGRESVGFLVHVKELLEDPTRLLLDI